MDSDGPDGPVVMDFVPTFFAFFFPNIFVGVGDGPSLNLEAPKLALEMRLEAEKLVLEMRLEGVDAVDNRLLGG